MNSKSSEKPDIDHRLYWLEDDGIFPNNPLWPLVVYAAVTSDQAPVGTAESPTAIASVFESTFSTNRWPPQWRSSIFDFHHFHSTSHEVLGVFDGSAELQFGGEDGVLVRCTAGDVVIIPAGVAHRCISQSPRFCCVGAYPDGSTWDTLTGQQMLDQPAARRSAKQRIGVVPAPSMDPWFGSKSSLFCPESAA